MHGLYEIWTSCGQGTSPGPRFRWLADARRYVAEHRGEASFAIRSPDGRWELIARRGLARGTRVPGFGAR